MPKGEKEKAGQVSKDSWDRPLSQEQKALAAEAMRQHLPAFIKYLIGEARHRDHSDASRDLLNLISDDLANGAVVDNEALAWLIECLREAAKPGGSFDIAAGLKLRRGKKDQSGLMRNGGSHSKRLRDYVLAMEVQSLVDSGTPATRNSTTRDKESACSTVAKRNGFKEKTIEAAYNARKKSFE